MTAIIYQIYSYEDKHIDIYIWYLHWAGTTKSKYVGS